MNNFCSNCGNQLNEGIKFCNNCGQPVGNVQMATPASKITDEQAEHVILEGKGSLLGGGTGKIVLTNKNIIWSKSKANFAFVGILAFVTKGDTVVNLETVTNVGTWTFLGGGGLQVNTMDGKQYKFGFNSKKDRDTAMTYIQQHCL